MLVLEVLHGTATQAVFECRETPITIGRAAANTIALDNVHLSSEHGTIRREGNTHIYRDLRSTNGSALERAGHRIAIDATRNFECVIEHGDVLVLGSLKQPVMLRVRVSQRSETSDDAEAGSDGAGTEHIIAKRAIGDLPSVATQLEHDPVSALRVYKALQRLSARVDEGATLATTAEAIFELLPRATHVTILLRAEVDRDKYVIATATQRDGQALAASDVRASRSVLRRVLADRAGLLLANAAQELSASQSILAANIQSTIAVPLWRGEDIIGVVQVDNRSSGMFLENDLEVMLLIASQAALAIDNARLFAQVTRAADQARGENSYLKQRAHKAEFTQIIGEAASMKAVLSQLERVINTRATVCIEGETGTGKELIASAVHYQSVRRDKMFVAQNCATLPEHLLESELFGHKRGAFTSADSDKKGLFELAHGGTMFLDEIGEMPQPLQAKLLRVLQEGTIRAVGAVEEKAIDVRIICATNRDLQAEVDAGRFRQDLFYRLMVFPIRLPPLRERREDIPLLAAHFLRRFCDEMRVVVDGFTPEALLALQHYHWPGNIRELENEIQRVVIGAEPQQPIDIGMLSPKLRSVDAAATRTPAGEGTLKEQMDQVERWLLTEALRKHDNNKTRTAATLGITREGLHKKLAKFGI
ncbi:MAG: sigma 54-interacting transcriptional regulator [Myxococcales bacterium]|nr:sigma 54-interacting transcriptional regulator [Myxococcales bacterium]